MNNINIRNGTPKNDRRALCLSCRFGFHTQSATGNDRILCTYLHKGLVVREKIVKCAMWEDKTKPNKYDFENLAWTLQTDKNRGPIGFQPPDRKDSL